MTFTSNTTNTTVTTNTSNNTINTTTKYSCHHHTATITTSPGAGFEKESSQLLALWPLETY